MVMDFVVVFVCGLTTRDRKGVNKLKETVWLTFCWNWLTQRCHVKKEKAWFCIRHTTQRPGTCAHMACAWDSPSARVWGLTGQSMEGDKTEPLTVKSRPMVGISDWAIFPFMLKGSMNFWPGSSKGEMNYSTCFKMEMCWCFSGTNEVCLCSMLPLCRNVQHNI